MNKTVITAFCSVSMLLGLALYAGQSVKPEMKALYDANVEALSDVEQVSESVYDLGDGRTAFVNMINATRDNVALNYCVASDGVCVLSSGKDANNKTSLYDFLTSHSSDIISKIGQQLYGVIMSIISNLQ